MERESIRRRRLAGLAPPWSADPVMAGTRFTNVHREDDKVTQYIRSSHVWSSPTMPVWPVLLARMLNRIPTLKLIEEYIDSADLDAVSHQLKVARDEIGLQIFSGAYTISTCGQKVDKIDYVLNVVRSVQCLDNADVFDKFYSDLYRLHGCLMGVKGLGSFLAAQVVADLKNIPGHPVSFASNKYTFSAPGPGSLAGLSAYFERKITPATYATALECCWEEVSPLLSAYVLPIDRQDFQNCCCEFSKYCRIKAGGHARNRYVPPSSPQSPPAALHTEASVA